MVYTDTTNITLNCKHILYIKVAYTNYLTSSLNISSSKTPVPNFSVLFTHPFTSKKLYYNSSLSLNKSIDLTNIGL